MQRPPFYAQISAGISENIINCLTSDRMIRFVLALKQEFATILQVLKLSHQVWRERYLTSGSLPLGARFPYQHTAVAEIFCSDAQCLADPEPTHQAQAEQGRILLGYSTDQSLMFLLAQDLGLTVASTLHWIF